MRDGIHEALTLDSGLSKTALLSNLGVILKFLSSDYLEKLHQALHCALAEFAKQFPVIEKELSQGKKNRDERF